MAVLMGETRFCTSVLTFVWDIVLISKLLFVGWGGVGRFSSRFTAAMDSALQRLHPTTKGLENPTTPSQPQLLQQDCIAGESAAPQHRAALEKSHLSCWFSHPSGEEFQEANIGLAIYERAQGTPPLRSAKGRGLILFNFNLTKRNFKSAGQ